MPPLDVLLPPKRARPTRCVCRAQVCQNILNASYKLRFDIGVYKISPELQDVITQLLERRVEHRIGCRVRGPDELYDHPFFAPIDFEKLKRFEYQPPWNPELQVRACARGKACGAARARWSVSRGLP